MKLIFDFGKICWQEIVSKMFMFGGCIGVDKQCNKRIIDEWDLIGRSECVCIYFQKIGVEMEITMSLPNKTMWRFHTKLKSIAIETIFCKTTFW